MNMARLAYEHCAIDFPTLPGQATEEIALAVSIFCLDGRVIQLMRSHQVIYRAARYNTMQTKHIRARFHLDWDVMPHPSLGIAKGSLPERSYVKEKILGYTKNLAFLHVENVSLFTL